MFGKVREVPQNEQTPFYPRSPYGVAKVYGHFITVNYRESYDLFAVSGHPLQPRVAAARPRVRDAQDHRRRRAHQARAWRASCALGNLDAQRDWGFAGDYVRAMWLMLQQDRAGRLRRRDRRDALGARAGEIAFGHVGLDWQQHVVVDPRFLRPAEVDLLLGDAPRRGRELGWAPRSTFERADRDDGRRRPRAARAPS